MSDYLRTLIKQDIKINQIASTNYEQDKNIYDIENFNKKLSGYYRGL